MKNNNNKNFKKNHRMYVIESTNTRKNGRWVPVLYLLVFRKEISPQSSQVSSALVLAPHIVV